MVTGAKIRERRPVQPDSQATKNRGHKKAPREPGSSRFTDTKPVVTERQQQRVGDEMKQQQCPGRARHFTTHFIGSLHFQAPAPGSRKQLGLIHGLHARRVHLENAWVYHLQQVKTLLLSLSEISL